MSWGKVPALTSDPAYPEILFPELFGPGRGCELGYSLGNQFLHLRVTLRTWGYCFLSHSVLGKGVSYAYDLGKVGRGKVPGLMENYAKCLGWWAITLSAWLRCLELYLYVV